MYKPLEDLYSETSYHRFGNRVVTVVSLTDGWGHEVQGVAIKCPSDEFDAYVGIDIASSRALRRLADELEKKSS